MPQLCSDSQPTLHCHEGLQEDAGCCKRKGLCSCPAWDKGSVCNSSPWNNWSVQLLCMEPRVRAAALHWQLACPVLLACAVVEHATLHCCEKVAVHWRHSCGAGLPLAFSSGATPRLGSCFSAAPKQLEGHSHKTVLLCV